MHIHVCQDIQRHSEDSCHSIPVISVLKVSKGPLRYQTILAPDLMLPILVQ